MGKKIVVHSFKGGTGKSNLTANIATALTKMGKTIAVVDSDIKSPGLHFIFNIPDEKMEWKLNDYLWGKCEIGDTVVELTSLGEKLFFIPASLKAGEILKILRDGYEVAQFNTGLSRLIDELDLDYLFVDTHPGLDEDTLLAIAASDLLLLLMRPDKQDYTGTAVSLEVAARLEKPTYIIVNKIPSIFNLDEVVGEVKDAYLKPVLGAIPFYEEVSAAASGKVFILSNPLHDFSKCINEITEQFLKIFEE
ncbi:MAG: P-loop NTPase [Nitrososphaeria archaeon]|nr:P-loop NTPase [Nitrososphaeria archaeon]NIN51864.1 P-loop NTPase [Nitrososphaeria archaeon]NIQ32412.1 P-loop NTPase [Nitrososphaeria archaeon]